jgi:hypothetical protein
MEQLTLFDIKTIRTWPTHAEIKRARKVLEEEADAMSRRPVAVAGADRNHDRDAEFRDQFSQFYLRGAR